MEQSISFKNSKGDTLSGILSAPSADTHLPLIILCHGFTSHKNARKYRTLTELLNKQHIATLRFDFYAHGDSEGDFEHITVSEAVDDILQAISWVKEKGYTNIGLLGASFGGIASLVAAAKTNSLSLLILISPVSNYPEKEQLTKTQTELAAWQKNGFRIYTNGVGKEFKLNYDFLIDAEKNDGYEAAKHITIPTLIVHGDNDESVPVAQSKKTAGLLQNGKLVLVNGADHRYTEQNHFAELMRVVMEFITVHTQTL